MSARKKIAILGYGGTIAMVPNAQGALAPAKSVEELMSFVPQLGDMADIELTQLENRDSTNINPTHWGQLAESIRERYGKCDAVIVTHGTDTMAYTASAVALALGREIQVPVIFTGSQLPISELGNDARFNLENSMNTALEAISQNIAEVMIVFSDRVMRAARAIRTSEARFDAFDTPAFPYLAQITATGVAFSPVAFKKVATFGKGSKPKVGFDSEIFTLDLAPGIDPQILRVLIRSKRCKAILMKSLGAGNVPSEGKFSLLPTIEEATAMNIPVLISTKFVGGKTLPDLYEPGKKALEAGAIPTGDMTDVMAQVKLMWLLGQGFKSFKALKEAIARSYVGEVS